MEEQQSVDWKRVGVFYLSLLLIGIVGLGARTVIDMSGPRPAFEWAAVIALFAMFVAALVIITKISGEFAKLPVCRSWSRAGLWTFHRFILGGEKNLTRFFGYGVFAASIGAAFILFISLLSLTNAFFQTLQ